MGRGTILFAVLVCASLAQGEGRRAVKSSGTKRAEAAAKRAKAAAQTRPREPRKFRVDVGTLRMMVKDRRLKRSYQTTRWKGVESAIVQLQKSRDIKAALRANAKELVLGKKFNPSARHRVRRYSNATPGASFPAMANGTETRTLLMTKRGNLMVKIEKTTVDERTGQQRQFGEPRIIPVRLKKYGISDRIKPNEWQGLSNEGIAKTATQALQQMSK